MICCAALHLGRPVLLYREGHVTDLSRAIWFFYFWLCASAIVLHYVVRAFLGPRFSSLGGVVLIMLIDRGNLKPRDLEDLFGWHFSWSLLNNGFRDLLSFLW